MINKCIICVRQFKTQDVRVTFSDSEVEAHLNCFFHDLPKGPNPSEPDYLAKREEWERLVREKAETLMQDTAV
ncbi:hypothetical protein EEL30_00180 (plasmid) [Brevibacillus laterosporus]|uniref:Uncharacterized protein n=1 Tax=Brevibacillus laterosporus TaxID=1465 RepID=A0A518V1R9_BRELA|nr:hypothetical protein EEL30_00180 [Brevibacillus laterosporus]